MSLATTINLLVSADYQAPLDLVTVQAPLALNEKVNLANGTGANQADKVFSDQRTVAASSSEELDLAGSLTDAFGNTITFARIKAIIIRAASGNANSVDVGGAASNGFAGWVADPTDVVKVRPGGTFVLIAPDATAYPVTPGTGDLLKIANGGAGTPVTYDIVIIGASA